MITNYDNGTFSVSQAKYENGLKQNIVPIKSLSTSTASSSALQRSSHTSRSSTAASPTTWPTKSSTNLANSNFANRALIIGISVALPLLIMCLLLGCAALLRRQRKERRKVEKRNDALSSRPSKKTDIQNEALRTPLEMSSDSFIDVIKELPDTGRIELRTHQTSTAFTNLPVHQAPTITSIASSRVSSIQSDNTLHVANMNSASANGSVFDIPPLTPDSRTKEIVWKGMDLNRPLPPTPTSRSTETSPSVPKSTQGPSLHRWLKEFFPNRAVSASFLNDLGLYNCELPDSIPRGLEITIPPPKPTSRWIRRPREIDQ